LRVGKKLNKSNGICLIKVNKCGILINKRRIYTAIGERGVMKTKIIGIALVFGLLAGGLGACSQTGGEGASPSPAESPTTSPSP
jgi:hypothetical protein